MAFAEVLVLDCDWVARETAWNSGLVWQEVKKILFFQKIATFGLELHNVAVVAEFVEAGRAEVKKFLKLAYWFDCFDLSEGYFFVIEYNRCLTDIFVAVAAEVVD